MHASTISLILAATASLVASTPTYVDHGLSKINSRTYVDKGVSKSSPGSEKRIKRGRWEIIDLGVRDLSPEEMSSGAGGLEARTARTVNGISTWGDNWMPVGNADDGNGYDAAVDEYCYHVTHTFDNKATIIGPGQYHAALVVDGYKLKGGIPAQVDFEIHNKMNAGTHTPDQNDCQNYLKKMSQKDSKCYGTQNQDTKGGTWQIGDSVISYHGLPAAKSN
ncbi:hypothetical protein GGR52DRAFT_570340 [Hypoxylon sp. FL1284]|nr:hypothetical protein GGR52DRAFT_570340 [Hypoxylon sp. FL1284]